jgi:hypothetical protein
MRQPFFYPEPHFNARRMYDIVYLQLPWICGGLLPPRIFQSLKKKDSPR